MNLKEQLWKNNSLVKSAIEIVGLSRAKIEIGGVLVPCGGVYKDNVLKRLESHSQHCHSEDYWAQYWDPMFSDILEQVYIDDMNVELLRIPEVEKMVGFKKAKIYQMIQEGAFPKQYNLKDSRNVAWKKSDIQDWVNRSI